MLFANVSNTLGATPQEALQEYVNLLTEAEQQSSGISITGDLGANQLLNILSLAGGRVEADALSQVFTDKLVAGLEIVSPKVVANEVNTNILSAATGTDLTVRLDTSGKMVFINNDGEQVAGIDYRGDLHLKGKISTTGLEIKDEKGIANISFDSQGNATFGGVLGAKDVKASQVVSTDIGQRFYVTDNTITVGELVSFDASLAHGAKRSAGAYDGHLLGVVSSSASMVVGEESSTGYERT